MSLPWAETKIDSSPLSFFQLSWLSFDKSQHINYIFHYSQRGSLCIHWISSSRPSQRVVTVPLSRAFTEELTEERPETCSPHGAHISAVLWVCACFICSTGQWTRGVHLITAAGADQSSSEFLQLG